MSEKHKTVFRNLNYFEHFLLFISAVTVYLSISVLASKVSIPESISSSALGLKSLQSLQELKSISQLSRKKEV